MKKLSLEMFRLTSADVLERSEMKKMTGGYGSGSCVYAYRSGGSWYGSCNVSEGEAKFMIAGYGSNDAYYCCESCGSTFYC